MWNMDRSRLCVMRDMENRYTDMDVGNLTDLRWGSLSPFWAAKWPVPRLPSHYVVTFSAKNARFDYM